MNIEEAFDTSTLPEHVILKESEEMDFANNLRQLTLVTKMRELLESTLEMDPETVDSVDRDLAAVMEFSFTVGRSYEYHNSKVTVDLPLSTVSTMLADYLGGSR